MPAHKIKRQAKAQWEPERKRVKRCDWCAGQPHAREPGRMFERGEGSGCRVVEIAPDWVCLKCGEPYAPEAPIERESLIGSSMARCPEVATRPPVSLATRGPGKRKSYGGRKTA